MRLLRWLGRKLAVPHDESKVVCSVSFERELYAVIDQLAQADGVSLGTLLKRAVACYAWVHKEAIEKHLRLIVADKSDNFIKELAFNTKED
jgi:hypothetical protein